MAKDTFYVTTAIDYVNAEPHIGHAYQKIVADALARWNRLAGKDTFFLTGTDEHGKKIARSAEKAGKTPRQFCDEISQTFKEAWKALEVQPDRFIRTTDRDHEKVVAEFVERMNKSGDIYKGEYSGLYCVDCETYYTEKEAPDKVCPVHKRPLELLKEETYFFKLSKYQKFLLDTYKKHPEFILPAERKNEIINRVKEGLQDLSITRTSFDWGIPFPLDKKHVIYVWYDALINYYTPCASKDKKKYWPADCHLLGKDNGWFHAVIWPAMLKSAGIKLPKSVFIHGFLTFNGEKISKSIGNAISPLTLANKYGADTIRYFSLRQFPFASGEDGDFSESALIDRHNNELANKLGNLIARVSTLAEKYGIDKSSLKLNSKDTQKKVEKHFENLEFDRALNEIFAFIDRCNEYIQDKKPWETHDKKVLYELANAIKDFTILLSPFIPSTAEKIAKTFNFEISLKTLKAPLKVSKIKKSDILFRKIDKSPLIQENMVNPPSEAPAGKISYDEFAKVELKVGKILDVEDHPKADKLYILKVDFGAEQRTIVAGLRNRYKKDELQGKKAVFVTNLAPVNLRGVESDGMILAAATEDDSQVFFIAPEKDIEEGSKIR